MNVNEPMTNPNDGTAAAASLPRVEPTPMPAGPYGGADPRRKAPLLAGVLSVLPGLGQVYVGYYRRGFAHFAIYVFLFTLLVNEAGGETLAPLFAFSTIFFFFYNLIDAVRRAKLVNLALDGIEQIDMPSDFSMPVFRGARGSVLGGIAAIAIGGVLFSYTKFDVPLDWVREWWPLAIVAFGVYLVAAAVADRARESQDSIASGPVSDEGR